MKPRNKLTLFMHHCCRYALGINALIFRSDGQVTCQEECISLILIQYFYLWNWVFLMFPSPHFIDFWGLEWGKCKVIYSSLLSYKFSNIAFPRAFVSIWVGDFTVTRCELCPSGEQTVSPAGSGPQCHSGASW